MKFLTLAVLASTLLSGIAKADVVSTTHPTVGTIMFPTATSALLAECVKAEGAFSCLWPISASAVTSLLFLKQDIQQVEQDAYNFLAGENISDALKDLVENLKSQNEELLKLSDQDIVGLMIVSLNA